MAKLNCWEVKKCGRQRGGAKTNELGICPAALNVKVHNVNGGKNGGRACWVLAGTFCGGSVQGSFAMKLVNCRNCNFYKMVAEEEGVEYVNSTRILALLK